MELWDKYLALSPWRYRRCRCWSDLKGKNWMALLMGHPEFAEVCDWSKLNENDWFFLLDERPHFARHCPKEVFDYWRKRGYVWKGRT